MASIASTDIAARIGGDEFTFLISGICNHEEAQMIANNILSSINKPMKINDKDFNINASIGFSVFPYDGIDAHLLVKIADSQMYKIKREKK
jgi:diguanylate cyclase (GGDEF)-like protein